ncbi:outer membrane protein assembly factor BamA [Microvirga aerophila]|uniref:Outer membrane protein assembly factor BamA n=2 Tax=Microvirga aerophila TaxID=670291 RepID=A0A512BNV6_9HYPH|nr:outer membrane protein assembly factor BamA [Microvirga aerophila]
MAGITAADTAFAQRATQGARRASAAQGPVINRVVVEGNKRVEKALIEGDLQVRARTPYNQTAIDADVQRILEVYRRSGRGLAQVTPRVVDLPNGTVDVVYTIVEGDKTGVKEIRFVGNNQISSSRLRGVMQTTETNLLSFLKSTDVYDPDRIAADIELIRRYYLKNGYADFRVVSNDVQFDPNAGGYVVTIAVEEGPQYRIGSVNVDSRIPEIPVESVSGDVVTSAGAVYNADAVQKSVQAITVDVARRGYPFAQVRPVGTRDPATQTIGLGYVIEEGPRVYIERINVRGNSRTRDYVIRREFDLGEGDGYNQVLIDRAERRLNNLGYFKRVRISNEPGSAPDRVVVNVDVEDQSTGAFSISGGYSTNDGFIGEVAVSESNFLGRGQFVRVAGQLGQRTNGVDFSFTEPYFLGYRMSAGIDLFSKFSDQTRYSRYENRVTGGQLRLGLPFTEEFTLTLRYSLFQQELDIPNDLKQPFNDCSVPIADYTVLNANGTPSRAFCEGNGEASLAIKESAGETLTSLAGLTFNYNTLDSNKDPRNGFYAEAKTDFAGLGGDSRYFRATGDARYYYELMEDIVGIARVQGGHIVGFGDKGTAGSGGDLRIVDQFFLGPSLVRGFATNGIGPRDISSLDVNANAIGGTTYFGGTLEVQFPIFGLPRDLGLKGAVFADAGTLFGYKGPTTFDVNGNSIIDGFGPTGCQRTADVTQECISVLDSKKLRSSVGASLLWSSPLGPIRFDYAIATSKEEGVLVDGVRVGGDRTQAFRFSGGTRF